MRLGNAAIRYTRNPAIGLNHGQLQPAQPPRTGRMTAQCAPTLEEAFATLVEFELLGSQNYRGIPALTHRRCAFTRSARTTCSTCLWWTRRWRHAPMPDAS
ncbi:hypothetical protein ULF88_21025 [Halopseudomonas pachastrellae]|nr:hypothetical protein [Halopseudomonas pachastrellae]